ncbi:MAG: glycosyltransferase family 39 protein, partial [Anaerolineales bacterium]
MPTFPTPDAQGTDLPSAATAGSQPPPRRILDRKLSDIFPPNAGNLLATVLLALTVITRLYGLGERVFTHDELNTITAAYSLAGSGHMGWSPMMHGPLEMHLTAASFIFFGDSDISARLPFALFGIATVGIALFLFRRYLGRAGALTAGLLILISPFMLYYARYTRNEALIAVWTLLSLYAVLRYLERGETKMLILFTAVYALHSTDKITSLIHGGGLMVFLAGYFLVRFLRRRDIAREAVARFLVCLTGSAVCLAVAAGLLRGADPPMTVPGVVFASVGLVVAVAGAFLLLRDGNWKKMRDERSFDLMVVLGTLTLPLISAAPVRLLGLDPMSLDPSNRIPSLVILLILAAASIAIGLLWRPTVWPFLAALFFGIFAFFFTSGFSNLGGLTDGLFNFFGYWISVQLLEGHLVYQPWFYYLLIQIPVYEFLPAFGTAVAAFLCWRRRLWNSVAERPFEKTFAADDRPVPFMALVLFWAIFNAAVFSYASEKMPQQTTLIAVPMILAAAWAVGYLLETGAVRIVLRPLGWIVGIPSRIAGWF